MNYGININVKCIDCGVPTKRSKSGRKFDRCKACYNIFIAPYCICVKRGIKCGRRANNIDLCSTHEYYRNTDKYLKWVYNSKKPKPKFEENKSPNVYLSQSEELKALDVLGLNYTATKEEIKKAYFKKIRESHPDKSHGSTEDKFREVHTAYKILSSSPD